MNEVQNEGRMIALSGKPAAGCCPASGCGACRAGRMARRDFVAGLGMAAAALALPSGMAAQSGSTVRQEPIRKPLRVQPVLMYSLPQRRNATSWRDWGGVQTEPQVADERNRIETELAQMKKGAEFPLEVLPLAGVRTLDEAASVAKGAHDVTLVYAAGGGANLLEALTSAERWNLIFLRHRSGPAYLWYEIAHPRYLRKTVDETYPGLTPDDIVVDSHAEILWRLRGLYGVKNAAGKRIVALGGASGWAAGGRGAPDRAREIWKFDIQEVSYADLGERLKRARANDSLVKRCRSEADRYLKQKGTTLETSRDFVDRCFLLTEVFRGLLDEFRTDAFTINQCMGTIMGASETTACLPLSILNDDGYMAFCESDFVVIPSGVLLHYISGKPVFLNDPTYPHDGVVTCAHCTAPRKLDGAEVHDVRILTHFESDYGAAPKVEFRKDQAVTNIVPDFSGKRWVGATGKVVGSPFMPICRSQADIALDGDSRKLVEEMRGFHWMTCYGDYARETGYAANKLGVAWVRV
jgi:hypothetical protein